MLGVAGGRVERMRFAWWKTVPKAGVKMVMGGVVVVIIEVEEYGHVPIYE